MLWLALVFPDLALECLPGLKDSDTSWVLTRHARVAASNPAARARGIAEGQSLSAAFALDPGLQQRPLDERLQAECLQGLAEWALGFSSEVSLEGELGLLLEVGSSRRYFGGLEPIRAGIRKGLLQRGHHFQDGIAPTPLAALWLAWAAPSTVVEENDRLPATLGTLRPAAAGLPAPLCEALHGVGIDTLAQVWSLPRSALARRFGPQLPELFDRVLGRQPDPRICLKPRQDYRRSVELAYPLQEVERLMGLVERMIPDLVDWSWRTARVLTRIALELVHERQAATRLDIGFAGTRNPAHLQLVIGERLEQAVLPAPVIGLQLEILASQDAVDSGADLLPALPSRLREGQELLERLRARLGHEAVCGVMPRADHRPELAWSYAEPGQRAPASGNPVSNAPRPVWLLEHPRDLGNAAVPRLGGPLRLLAGPERIESGWWDGQDVARDYFVAAGPDGPQYWVYRERRGEARWFLQGVFS